jgi:hypothetical protein
MSADTAFLELVKNTIMQSLHSHIQQEQYCRTKARKARLNTNKQEYTRLADKYKNMLDTNKLMINLIDERIAPYPNRSHANQKFTIAASTKPLSIPDTISEIEIPNQYICPITTEIMSDPVLLTDGHVYEKLAIQRWLLTRNTSPITNALVCKDTIIPCFALKSLIDEFISNAA